MGTQSASKFAFELVSDVYWTAWDGVQMGPKTGIRANEET